MGKPQEQPDMIHTGDTHYEQARAHRIAHDLLTAAAQALMHGTPPHYPRLNRADPYSDAVTATILHQLATTTTTTTTNKTQTSTTNSTTAETQLSTSAVSKNIADAVKSGSTTATVKVKNAKTIDAATIKNVAAEAAKAGVNSKIHADQVVGGKVVARM